MGREGGPGRDFVTHGHGDHVGDAAAIARRTGAPVCCTADLADAVFVPAGWHASRKSGRRSARPWLRQVFQALHGGGAAGCPACGFLEMGAGRSRRDTALMTDMTLLADETSTALLPIGDFYTMGSADAPAVKLIRPD